RKITCQRSSRWLTSFKPALCKAKKKLPARMKTAPRPLGESESQKRRMRDPLVAVTKPRYKARTVTVLQQRRARPRHVTPPSTRGPHPRRHQERLHHPDDRRARRAPRAVDRAADRRVLSPYAGRGAARRRLGVRLRLADLESVHPRHRDEARAAQRIPPPVLPMDASGPRLA